MIDSLVSTAVVMAASAAPLPGGPLLRTGMVSLAPSVVRELRRRVSRCSCSRSHLKTLRMLDKVEGAVGQHSHSKLVGDLVGTGSIEVNVGAIWQLMTHQMYEEGDLPVLAIREAVQNGRDAIIKAIKSKQIDKGIIRVTWKEEGDFGTLTVSDNGIGMDENVLRDKFFVLGETGKAAEDAEDTASSLGGFGAAKAVILGSSSAWDWMVETRDLVAVSKPGLKWAIHRADKPRQGTRVTIRKVFTEYRRGYAGWDYTRNRILALLAASDLGSKVKLFFNGALVEKRFPRRRGSFLKQYSKDFDWGPRISVSVRRYKQPSEGRIWVRLGGLVQFSDKLLMGKDIVVDVTTGIRPKEVDYYPFNASRDRFNRNTPAGKAWVRLVVDIMRAEENERKGPQEISEYSTILPDADLPEERKASEQFSAMMEEVFGDSHMQGLLSDLSGLSAAFYEEQDLPQKRRLGDEGPADEDEEGQPADPYKNWRRLSGKTPKVVPGQPASTEMQETHESIREFTEKVVGYMPDAIGEVLKDIEAGHVPYGDAVESVVDTLGSAVAEQAPTAVDQSGLSEALAVGQIAQYLAQNLPSAEREKVVKKAKDANPFGRAAVIQISNENYLLEADPDATAGDKKAARKRVKRFYKQARKIMPLLVLWDFACRTVAKEGGVQINFDVGFVLDDTVRAMATETGDPGVDARRYVMINPDKLQEVIKVYQAVPLAIASYIHSMACHELAHLPNVGGSGMSPSCGGHNEKWAVEREDLAASTGHLLALLSEAVPRALPNVKAPVDKAGSLSKEIEKAKARAAEANRLRRVAQRRATKLEKEQKKWLDGSAQMLTPLVHRLEALTQVWAFTEWVQGPGKVLVPPPLNADQVVALVRNDPGALFELVLQAAEEKQGARRAAKSPVSGYRAPRSSPSRVGGQHAFQVAKAKATATGALAAGAHAVDAAASAGPPPRAYTVGELTDMAPGTTLLTSDGHVYLKTHAGARGFTGGKLGTWPTLSDEPFGALSDCGVAPALWAGIADVSQGEARIPLPRGDNKHFAVAVATDPEVPAALLEQIHRMSDIKAELTSRPIWTDGAIWVKYTWREASNHG